MTKEYIKNRFKNTKNIIENFYKDKKLDIKQKLPLNDFVSWCKQNKITLLKTQTDKIENPGSLTLIELMTYINQKPKMI